MTNVQMMKMNTSVTCSYEDIAGNLTSDNEKEDSETETETDDTDEEQPITFK